MHGSLNQTNLTNILIKDVIGFADHYLGTFNNTEQRSTSGGGALAAGALVYTPASVFDAGLGMIDQNSRSLIVAASSTANIDLASIAFVSSNGLN